MLLLWTKNVPGWGRRHPSVSPANHILCVNSAFSEGNLGSGHSPLFQPTTTVIGNRWEYWVFFHFWALKRTKRGVNWNFSVYQFRVVFVTLRIANQPDSQWEVIGGFSVKLVYFLTECTETLHYIFAQLYSIPNGKVALFQWEKNVARSLLSASILSSSKKTLGTQSAHYIFRLIYSCLYVSNKTSFFVHFTRNISM